MDKVIDHLLVFEGEGKSLISQGIIRNIVNGRIWNQKKRRKNKQTQRTKQGRLSSGSRWKMSFKEKKGVWAVGKEIEQLENKV